MHTAIKLALLGKGISHSKSPEIYRRLISGSVQYDLLDVANEADIPGWQYNLTLEATLRPARGSGSGPLESGQLSALWPAGL